MPATIRRTTLWSCIPPWTKNSPSRSRRQFERETGIVVKLISDTEKAKSSGLLNRLLEEGGRPQCDVFLSEDPVRSAVLKKRGLSTPYQSPAAQGLPPEFSDPDHHWTGMSARVRVLLVNMKHPLFKNVPMPTSVYDLADPRYKGQACIGNPLFGTTTLHCLAIFQQLGEAKARELFEKMLENEVHVVQSDGDDTETGQRRRLSRSAVRQRQSGWGAKAEARR